MKKIIVFIFYFLSSLYANTIEVGFVYWKKDNAPQKYNAYLYGIKKAIDDYKKQNKDFEISVLDFNEKGNVKESIKIAKEIAKRENMVAVIGFSNSKRAISSIEFVSQENIPIISSAGSLDIFKKDMNQSFFTTNFGIKGELEYLKQFIQSKSYKNIVFISQKNDEYSDEYFSETSKIMPDIKHVFLLDIHKINLKNIINKDTLIIISTNVLQNAKISKELRNQGIQNDIFLGRGGIVGDEFYKNGGQNLDNIYELSTLLAGVSNEKLLKFKNENKDYFNAKENEPYLEYAVYGYDVMNLIFTAYNRANKIGQKIQNPKEIRKMIKSGLSSINEQNPYDGVATIYSFDKNRIGGKLTPQYILKTNGTKSTLYEKQYIYQNGILKYIPSLYTNINIKSISIKNQDVSQYDIEMMLTLISESNITLNDIEFENIVINDSSFKPSIYAKEFLVSNQQNNKLKRKIYNIKALFQADSSIENFPFDSHELPILIKPKNPVDKNFINIFISDFDNNIKNIDISGWRIKGGYAGFKKGNYEYISDNFEKQKEYYYRSSFTTSIERKALGSAVKFILPLVIVFSVSLVLFAMPDNAFGDKVGASSNILITIAALYFTYATLVNVDYLTLIDWLYMGSLGFILLVNSVFVVGQRIVSDKLELSNKYKKTYILSFVLSLLAFVFALIYLIQKADF